MSMLLIPVYIPSGGMFPQQQRPLTLGQRENYISFRTVLRGQIGVCLNTRTRKNTPHLCSPTSTSDTVEKRFQKRFLTKEIEVLLRQRDAAFRSGDGAQYILHVSRWKDPRQPQLDC